MSTYRLPRIAELANSLRLSPARLTVQQVFAADYLLTLIDPEQYYPYSWVRWHITGFRAPIGEVDPADLRGSALMHDILLLCLDLTKKNPIPQDGLPWPVWEIPQLAERLSVSTKTITRWREEGLPVWWTLRPDGEVRLSVPESGLRRFVAGHLETVMRSRRFSQLSDKQREQVLERAEQLRAGGCLSTHQICRMISTEIGRSAETIRYTLARHAPATAEGPNPRTECTIDEHRAICQCYEAGDPLEALAARFGKTPRTIRKIVLAQQRRQLLARKVQFLYSPEFDLPDAESRILGEPWVAEAATADVPARAAPEESADLSKARLVILGTEDPLTAGEETTLFRRYNYGKFRLAALQQLLRRATSAEVIEEAINWSRRVDTLRSRLVETNLRLVVSVARRHARYGASLEEMASEGNMVLMRAIEKFDYTRGYKFSTYATWALMKHFSRLMPLWQASRRRQQTGCDEVLKGASTVEPVGQELEQQLVGKLVHGLLGNLSKRERKIIQWHYGLPEGTTARSLTEIAVKMGVSKERVRQIEARGLGKLKALLDERQLQYL